MLRIECMLTHNVQATYVYTDLRQSELDDDYSLIYFGTIDLTEVKMPYNINNCICNIGHTPLARTFGALLRTGYVCAREALSSAIRQFSHLL